MFLINKNLNFLKKIPFVRRFVYNYLKNWADKNPDSEVITFINNGLRMKLTVKDWVQNNLFIYGYYEKNESDYWLKRSEKAKIIIDIGANVGYYSLLAAKNIERNKGKIFAFEPVNKTFIRLGENILLNKIDCISIYKKAISNENSSIKINVGNDENWGMSSINSHEHLSSESEIVECETLDTFCNSVNISQVDLIKIDVEGAEYNVLQGMEKAIEKYKPEVLIEVLDQHLNRQNISSENVFNFFWGKGYTSYLIIKNGELQQISEAKSHQGLICFKYSTSL